MPRAISKPLLNSRIRSIENASIAILFPFLSPEFDGMFPTLLGDSAVLQEQRRDGHACGATSEAGRNEEEVIILKFHLWASPDPGQLLPKLSSVMAEAQF